ncbi:hypothetical protein EES44_24635 [Streptomyces sp. ADI96-15]|uniref:hypothetical protein n=1 Tax=Streptomyces sp. ADI96-15 TaxID=1522761 RepID=UPI000F553161|nr:MULTISPECIES: hypothetical protein [unclassified Streptomyces]MDH6189195.1 hypothetical protein [Streptomyces sp. CZ24]RPK58123.1 hypothetical protein EES44_24635 [Streptomyces sp. ADI96-15]
MSTTTARTAAPAKPRGDCQRCGLSYALTKDGKLGRHHGITQSGFSTGQRCPGVGLAPYVAVGA